MVEDIKILIVAQNASTRMGGEAIIPIHYFRSLRDRGYSVQLLAHARNRADLEEVFNEASDQIYYIEDTVWHRIIWNIGKLIPLRLFEVLFSVGLNIVNEHFQRRHINKLVADGRVEIIHQPIPVSPKMPSSIYGFGVPVVIGPMNGGMTYPLGWEQIESRAERYLVRLFRAFSPMMERLIPGKSRANVLLVANERTLKALSVSHKRVQYLVENGVDRATFVPSLGRTQRTVDSFRLVFMGRLIKLKAVDFTLAAIAEARARGLDVTFDVLGEGPDRARLELLTQKLNLQEEVRYFGFLSQPECIEVLQAADALILNSVHECGGAVVLEAMSLGLPVIASEWGGPLDYLDFSTGVLVHPSPRETFASRLADAIERLVVDPELRIALGQAGADRVANHFDWERKVDRIVEIYERELKSGGKIDHIY